MHRETLWRADLVLCPHPQDWTGVTKGTQVSTDEHISMTRLAVEEKVEKERMSEGHWIQASVT